MDGLDWSNGGLSREDLSKLVKGFVDMLIIASGYQSSGLLAHWDSTNIKKAFQWALFFENAFKGLRCSDGYQDFVEQINEALLEIKSSPRLPLGLQHISSVSLSRAKVLMLKHLVNTLPLRDLQLKALVTAIAEMDIDGLQRTDIDGLQRTDDRCFDIYLEKLSHDPSNTILTWRSICVEDSMSASTNQSRDTESTSDYDLTKFAVEELGKRRLQVLCMAAAETGLDILSKITRKSNCGEIEATLCRDQIQNETTSMIDERVIEPVIWNRWKSRSLSYLLNRRTVRLASGANLFFSAPKHQWIDVINRLSISHDSDEDISEKTEILLLGTIVHRWSSLIKILMSNSYEPVSITKMYHEVQNLPLRRFQNLFSKKDSNPEENGVLEYLEGFLSNHFHHLWRLSPVLAAMAIPSRSPLFRSYIIELDGQMRGDSSADRCRSCTMNGEMHDECELAERIWCLYVFHVCGSCLIVRVLEEQIMKFPNTLALKRIQLLKWGRRVASSSSAVTLGNIQRRAPVSCCHGSYVARQLVWRLKSLWKAAVKWQRSSIRYGYDAHSYSKNFDDGSFKDRPSPLVPK